MVVPFTMVGVMKELAGLGSRQQIITLMLLNLRSVSHLNEGVQ